MKFSESWLREWVQPQVETAELVEQLTMAGLEVDAVESVAGEFSGVVVGLIKEAEQHPDADKLRVCQVEGPNGESFQVVCGAPNARVGLKAPFAMIGAVLPGNFKIKKAKLRGVESFGMLCGQTELEAGDDDSGLWELAADAPVGEDLRAYLSLDDKIIEVDLTPNRADCLGLKGIAREVGVLNRCDVSAPQIETVAPATDSKIAVTLKAPQACPRYLGRVVEGVDLSKPSPLWLQEKLRRSDVRPIDAVVDVTNYVLLELGQPMHAFDLNKISGGIQVRMAEQGEALTLLDEQEIKLNDDTLVIADDKQALAAAGIMGGLSSSVTAGTQNLLLEAAYFDPIAIAGRARNYGLHTDSSHRFERGVDYNLAAQAMERATGLIIEICGGQAGPVVVAEDQANLPTQSTVTLRKKRIESGLGFAIPDADVIEILNRLGLEQLDCDEQGWTFKAPSYRFDIAIEEDLLEELARIYGYNKLPTTTNFVPQKLPSKSESQKSIDELSAQLVARDYREVITYSFIDPALQQRFFADDAAVNLLNPISADLSVMRTSLIPGLVQTCANNLKRQHSRIRLFERGLRFVPGDQGLAQVDGLAGLICGERYNASWHGGKEPVDFYDIKGDLESLLAVSELSFGFEAEQGLKHMHPGQCASILSGGEKIGYVGALHPELAKAVGLKKAAFVFELDLKPVLQSKVPAYQNISRYPEVERDLAFLAPVQTPASTMLAAIQTVAGENLKQLKVFDIYSGEGIDSERKSIAFNLTFQHSSRTLNEDEVNAAVDAVISKLEGEFDATLR
ncbi:phenylalanine--tRNA ligase subunit beta [Agaribacterium haliotis]|uniref:phenylalanine--tRNA ligase subunit beta n=1 Tax=Agaribacterium haliotis TaxID=2013869 RepID=UPI000BB55C4B|nr:phenylalanine--tRNA ligase subunit beta [Agaribacterium haliotis]